MSDCERNEKWKRINALDKKVNARTEWVAYNLLGERDIFKEIDDFGLELHVVNVENLSKEDFPIYRAELEGYNHWDYSNKWVVVVPAPINFVLAGLFDSEQEAVDEMILINETLNNKG